MMEALKPNGFIHGGALVINPKIGPFLADRHYNVFQKYLSNQSKIGSPGTDS